VGNDDAHDAWIRSASAILESGVVGIWDGKSIVEVFRSPFGPLTDGRQPEGV